MEYGSTSYRPACRCFSNIKPCTYICNSGAVASCENLGFKVKNVISCLYYMDKTQKFENLRLQICITFKLLKVKGDE